MPRTIRYAYHLDGYFVAFYNRKEWGWPILDYDAIGKDGDYNAPLKYDIKKTGDSHCPQSDWAMLIFTKVVPTWWKNVYRELFGMKLLKEEAPPKTLEELLRRHRTQFYIRNNKLKQVAVRHSVFRNSNWTRLYYIFQKTRRGYIWLACNDEKPEGRIQKLAWRTPLVPSGWSHV
jgi:hypothetical protein